MKKGVGTNRYAYAGDDPVNFSDPNGHHWIANGNGRIEERNGTWHNHDPSRDNQKSTVRDGVAFALTNMPSITRENFLNDIVAQRPGAGGSQFIAGNAAAGPFGRLTRGWSETMIYGLVDALTLGRGSVTAQSVLAAVAAKGATRVELTEVRRLVATHGLTLSNRAFQRLVDDIAANGIKETIKYVEVNGVKYVVDGHHRLEAATRLGIETVPTQRVELPFGGYKSVDDLQPHYPRDWMD